MAGEATTATANDEHPTFEVGSVTFTGVSGNAGLVRVRGAWRATEQRQVAQPALVVESGGTPRTFGPLPGAGAPVASPQGTTWAAGFAVPAGLLGDAGARWTLAVGEMIVALPAPASHPPPDHPLPELRPAGSSQPLEGARRDAGAADRERRIAADLGRLSARVRELEAACSTGDAQIERLREELVAEQARARRAEELLRGERDRALQATATARECDEQAAAATARARELEEAAEKSQDCRRAAERARDEVAGRLSELTRALEDAERQVEQAAEQTDAAVETEARRRRQAETAAASAREARQVAEQRAAEATRAGQDRGAELERELASARARVKELEGRAGVLAVGSASGA
jgi:hypothetical protein